MVVEGTGGAVMADERDERHWYGGWGWVDLRRELGKLALRHADDVLDALADGVADEAALERACRAWVEATARDAQARAVAGSRKAALWTHAVSLLGAPQALAAVLARDRALRREGGRREGALVVCLYRHLEAERLAALGRPHRQKVWERVDRISRRLTPADTEPGHRCGEAHFRVVLEEIRRRHPDDRNLPRTLDTLRVQFWEFCAECWGELPDDDVLSGDDLAVLREATGLAPDPVPCFDELWDEAPEAAESFAVVNGLQELLPGPERFATVAAFAAQRSLSKRQVYKRNREARDRLEACMRRQIEDGTGEPWASGPGG
jgi:hypothetical protein